MRQPSAAVSPNPPLPAIPAAVHEGGRIRWLGRCWVVEAIHHHPHFGYFYRLRGELDDAYELISATGADGNFEVLAAA